MTTPKTNWEPCTCKADLEQRLTERYKGQLPNATEHKVELQGYGLSIQENEMKVAGYMQYKAWAVHPLKNGGVKPKSITGNMFFSYCPFCGQKAGAA